MQEIERACLCVNMCVCVCVCVGGGGGGGWVGGEREVGWMNAIEFKQIKFCFRS